MAWDTRINWRNLCWHLYVGLLSFFVIATQPWTVGSAAGRHWERNQPNYAKPRFVPTGEQNITHSPGERAVLKCQVEHLGTKTVTWKRRGELHPLTIGLFPFAPDTRISVDYNQRINEWSLIIQTVKPSDEGVYQCIISTKDNNIKPFEVQLNIKKYVWSFVVGDLESSMYR